MPSTFSLRERLELQADGENSSTWGQKANVVFQLIDEALSGYLSKSVAGTGNITLTASNSVSDEVRQNVINLTGVLTGARNVIVPTQEGEWFFVNNTTGAFTLTVKTIAGTGITVLQGFGQRLFCDGTNVLASGPVINTSSGGAWELIGTATPSASATVDFTWAGKTFRKIMLIFDALPATDGAAPWIRTSTDASTFDSGASDYSWASHARQQLATAPAETNTGDEADSEITIGNVATGNVAGEGVQGVVEIIHPANATNTSVIYHGSLVDIAGTRYLVTAAGFRLSAADVDGIRFLFSSGNIASGEFACYGLQ